MNLILLAALCAMCILPRFTQQSKSYHCKRPKHVCVVDTCDAAEGKCGTCAPDTSSPPVTVCTCSGGEKGEDCGITSTIVSAACSSTPPDCSAEGTLSCYSDGSADKCYCKEDYYGTLCENKRLDLECSGTELIPKIIPFKETDFGGLMYVKDKHTDPTCLLAADSGSPAAYTKTITFTGSTCGVSQADVPLTGTKTGDKYCMDVIVQYSPDYVTIADLQLTMCCNKYTVNQVVDHDDIIAATVGDVTGLVTHPVETTETGMTVSLLDATNDAALTAATLGQAAKLKFTLATGGAYAAFQVWSVGFDSSNIKNTGTMKYLVKDGCAQLAHQSVMVSFKLDGTDVVLEFTVFKFSAANAVYIFIEINICPTACTTTPLLCDTAATDIVKVSGTWEGVGRRKRQANDVDKSQSVNLSFFVVDPSLTSTVFDRPLPKEQSCLATLTFLLPLVVLVIICLMSIIAAMYFCVKLTHRNRGDPERLHGMPGPYKE